ncbi:zf-RING_2 domain-containing protein [Cephalotus follicularis]|uniref:RING-type E3 ubiquitin transferase n=1 Tax=Cephalotus follicularis TaxID=3775 RepID=A0A1Q3B0Z7_CEPFO|nr:zf-RING_2 domain-containing protein [Cephalotus follicularis]
MDPVISKSYMIHDSQAFSPITSQGISIIRPGLHSSSGSSFPIIAIAIVGILATAFLLVSYYVFVIKCCLNWQRIDILRRFSLSRRRDEDPLMAHSPAMEARGLDESVIRSIPIFQFKKGGDNVREIGERRFCECSVCLNEFQEDEKLRIIPYCGHVFHIDCIDIWLQSSANCPLCRTSISSTTRFQAECIIAPSSSPQDPNPYPDHVIGVDEDYVVIELGSPNSVNQALFTSHDSIGPSPRKLEQRIVPKKGRKLNKVTSMGDECIDIRGNDDQFAIQPIRRSFSMDSSSDRQLYLAIQEIVKQNSNEVISPIEGCSSRGRRNFFSFGHDRGSRSAVLPVYMEL